MKKTVVAAVLVVASVLAGAPAPVFAKDDVVQTGGQCVYMDRFGQPYLETCAGKVSYTVTTPTSSLDGWWTREDVVISTPSCPQGERETASGWACSGAYEVPVAFTCPLKPDANLEACLGLATKAVLELRRGEFISDENVYLQAEADYASLRGALEQMIASIDAMNTTVVLDQGERARRLVGLLGDVRKAIDNGYDYVRTPVNRRTAG